MPSCGAVFLPPKLRSSEFLGIDTQYPLFPKVDSICRFTFVVWFSIISYLSLLDYWTAFNIITTTTTTTTDRFVSLFHRHHWQRPLSSTSLLSVFLLLFLYIFFFVLFLLFFLFIPSLLLFFLLFSSSWFSLSPSLYHPFSLLLTFLVF